MKSTDLWVNWACWSGEAWNKAWGAKWLHLRYLFCKCVPSGPRTPAKVWHGVTNLLWLVPELHWNKVVDRAVGVGVQALNGRISPVVSDFLLLIIFKDLFSHLSCSPFPSLFLLHPPLSLPCCTSSCHIRGLCSWWFICRASPPAHFDSLLLSFAHFYSFYPSVLPFPLSLFSWLLLSLIFPALSVSSPQSLCHCPSISRILPPSCHTVLICLG